MEASILDLRKNMKKVMSALERNERVTLTRRRRKMAVIVPAGEKQARKIKAADLAAFGMWADREDMQDVSAYVRELRKPRSFLMLFDTDVLIWALRGNPKAAAVIDGAEDRFISAVTYMELIQGARNKAEQKLIKDFLSSLGFQTVPIDENISLRATVFMEEFCLKSGMGLADALIFATACEHTMTLCSANKKHYKEIASLTAKEFRP